MPDLKTTDKARPVSATNSATSGASWTQRLAGAFRPAPGGGANGQRRSPTSRFIVGSVTFIIVAELLTYLMYFLNAQFNLHLERPVSPTVSWLTPYLIVNVVIIGGLWILLNRLGFFPRDMWAQRNGTTTGGRGAASGANGTKGGKASANQIPGIGKQRTRADRRAAAISLPPAKANGKSNATSVAEKDAGRRGGAAVASRTTEAVVVTGEHDDAYERARAAQRLRRRRDTRR